MIYIQKDIFSSLLYLFFRRKIIPQEHLLEEKTNGAYFTNKDLFCNVLGINLLKGEEM